MHEREFEIGVVVVGLGRAGQARVRDVSEVGGCRLVGTVSRRPGAGSITLDDALTRPDVHAVILATENDTHAQLARQFLAAGRHVAVEFPLANTADDAVDLFRLAQQQGRVLHTEAIGLLTRSHAALRAFCRDQAFVELDLNFQGDLQGWVAEEANAGRLGQLAVGRLHVLWDLLGPLTVQSAALHREGRGYRLEARLTGWGGSATLVERRADGMVRGRTLVVQGADGDRWQAEPERPEPGLFRSDLERFVDRVRSGGDEGVYLPDEDVLGVLRVAEELSQTPSIS
jgi:predicted dehydrogenase